MAIRSIILIALLLILITPVFARQDAPLPPDASVISNAAKDMLSALQGTPSGIGFPDLSFLKLLLNPPMAARIVLMVGGLSLLLLSWLIYDFTVMFTGAVLGAAVALTFAPDPDISHSLIPLAGGAAIGGVISGILYNFAVTGIGGYLGLSAVQGAALMLGVKSVSTAAVIIGVLVGALLLLILSRSFLIVFAAIVGALMVGFALNFGLVVITVLALVGIVIQVLVARWRGVDIRRRPARRFLFMRRDMFAEQ